jgi:carbamoylphosphate synthase large subunit
LETARVARVASVASTAKVDEHFCHTAAKAAEAITMGEIENRINYENYKSEVYNRKYL